MSQELSFDKNIPKSNEEKLHFVQELCQPLQLSVDTLKKVKDLYLKEIKIGLGLGKRKNVGASIKCLPTYIQKLPTDCQQGRCFVIEISGRNVFILLLTFNGTMEYKNICEKYVFPEHLLEGDTENLVNYMVVWLCRFVKKLSLHLENLPLAISLATYLRQDDKTLWKKNLNVQTAIGENVLKLLQNAVEYRGDIKISNYELINDTAAVLMSSAWKNNYSKIGVVVDQSCSVCYLEHIKNVTALDKSKTIRTIPAMIVSTELGNFGANGSLNFIRTPWDHRIDELCHTKSRHEFEKMVSVGYLGALVLFILMDCIKAGVLLEGKITTALNAAKSFPISYIIGIESQSFDCYHKTRDILRVFGYKNPENIDCVIVRNICETVTCRSIHLVAAALAGLIDHIGDPYVVVGFEGTLCRYRPNYREDLHRRLRELVKPEHKFDLIDSEGGRGCGAALAAFKIVKSKKLLRAQVAKEPLLNVRTKSKISDNKRKLMKSSAGKSLRNTGKVRT